jgi:peptidoglycan hydrolase-like protein with peptidoglycan-binding domain
LRLYVRTIVLVALLLVGATASLRADEGIRQVQEELRKRNLYFGDIDGQSTPELIGALKRYQQRKGFKVTGTVDGDTAASLHVQSTVASTDKDPSERADLPIDPEPPAEAPAPSQDISPDRVNKFVEAYLRDAETNDIYLQAWFYAFPVQYFEHGLVGLEFVTRDIRYHVKDWPERKYKLAGPATLIASGNEGETLIEFSIDYERRNKKRATSGRAKYFWTVESKGDDLRIVSIREQLLPNK